MFQVNSKSARVRTTKLWGSDHSVNRLRNPLYGINKFELLDQVTAFANQHGLTEVLPQLKKGALVAQNPQGWETIEELDESDKGHLRRETTHRWNHPRMLYFLVVMSSIGAAVQGWDQTGKVTIKIVLTALVLNQALTNECSFRIQRSQSILAIGVRDTRLWRGVYHCWHL